MYEFERGEDEKPGHVVHLYSLHSTEIADPSGVCKDAPNPEHGFYRGNLSPQQAHRLLNAEQMNAYKAALEAEPYINSVLNALNAANVPNIKRLKTAMAITSQFVSRLVSRRGERVYLRARSYAGFKRQLETEAKNAMEMVKSASFGVKVSLPLQNSMIDAAELANTRIERRAKTPAYKKAIQKVRESSDELRPKSDGEITQLQLFEDEIQERVATSLLHQANGNATGLVLKIMQIRQQARQFAKAHGIKPLSRKAVDMFELGYPIACYFPSGLGSNRFTIVANDLLKELNRPYQGMNGSRERKQAEADLFHFAALEYRQDPVKGNTSRALVHSFNMKAITKGEGKGRVRYWVFDNLSEDLLLPKNIQYGELETDFVSFVYEHYTRSREKAGAIIKFMTMAAVRLHKEIRKNAAAGNACKEPEITIRFDENYWPQFETKAENDEAKQVMQQAFGQCGMIAKINEPRAYTMKLKATVIMEGYPPQQIEAPKDSGKEKGTEKPEGEKKDGQEEK